MRRWELDTNTKQKLPKLKEQEREAIKCITPGKNASLGVPEGGRQWLEGEGFLQQKDNLVVTGCHWVGFSKAGSYMTLHEENSETPE